MVPGRDLESAARANYISDTLSFKGKSNIGKVILGGCIEMLRINLDLWCARSVIQCAFKILLPNWYYLRLGYLSFAFCFSAKTPVKKKNLFGGALKIITCK